MMMQANMSCVGSSQVSAYNAVTDLQSEWVRWYGTMLHSQPEEGVCNIHQNVFRTETQDVADPNSQNHTVLLKLANAKDNKNDTSCTLNDRIQLNVLSVSNFTTLTCDISYLIIQVLLQCDDYGCTCCDHCKLINKVPISAGCYSICDESMKQIKHLIWYIQYGSNLLRSSLFSELSEHVTSFVGIPTLNTIYYGAVTWTGSVMTSQRQLEHVHLLSWLMLLIRQCLVWMKIWPVLGLCYCLL